MWGIIVLFAGLLLSGVWVGISLGAIGSIILFRFAGFDGLGALPLSAWRMLYDFSYVALPMYVFLGELFVASGLADKTYSAIAPILERLPGKLLLSNVVLDAMFGSIVGTSMATAATVGSIAYPELSRRGYNKRAIVGNLAGGGTLGSFVPPSMGLIIYGAWVNVSVGKCFLGILIPAIITVVLFMAYLMTLCTIRPETAPAGKVLPLWDSIVAARGIWPVLLLMVGITGSIYLGVATAVEAAGLASLVSILIAIAMKTLVLKKLHEAARQTLIICGTVILIMLGATIFSSALALSGILEAGLLRIEALGLSPTELIVITCVVYLVLGCFFDGISMLLMTLPFLYPLVMNAGIDLLVFGAIYTITGEMGLLTPPVGMNLFILQGVTHGEVPLGEVARGAMPYFLLLGVTLILVILFPQLVTWLPQHAI